MGNRNMKKAADDFYIFCRKHNYSGFAFSEILQIVNHEPSKAAAVMDGIAAGFMYGYNYAKRESRSGVACHSAKLANQTTAQKKS